MILANSVSKYYFSQIFMDKILFKYFTLLLIVTLSFSSFSQSKKNLQKQKQKKQKEIAYTNKLLKQTRKNKKKSFNALLLINKQINNRQQLISTIQQEINKIENKIDENNLIITSMSNDLKMLQNEYAKLIYYAWKNQNSYSRIMFILAARDFNQAYKRLQYLQQYTSFRKKQAEAIKHIQSLLLNKIQELNSKKEEQNILIISEQQENNALAKAKNEKSKIISSLKQQESGLLSKLRKQKKDARKLQNKITKIITEEAKKAAAKANKAGSFALTPEEKLISDKFGANKGRLPWPTATGVITGNFGKHQHPVLKEITIMNDGIDISTTPGSFARAVFDGEVARVISISNYTVVMIKHGEYFSVYTHLSEVLVSRGDKVKAKQKIGLIKTNKEEHKTTVQLQIWKGTKKLNPSGWISKK